MTMGELGAMLTTAAADERTVAQSIADELRTVAVFRSVLQDPICGAVLDLLAELARERPNRGVVAEYYARAFALLAEAAHLDPLPGVEDAWQAHLTALLLDQPNPVCAQAERFGVDGVASGLRDKALRELSILRRLHDLDGVSLLRLISHALSDGDDGLGPWAPWSGLTSPSATSGGNQVRSELRHRLASDGDWADLFGDLVCFWAQHGCGTVARYHMLRWDSALGALRGIAHPDDIALADLVAYDREQRLLLQNTERFLKGIPAHHVLLYGLPGTGKSSTVKALVNHFAPRGLRLVEVRKEDLLELAVICAALRDRAPHFILFVDDLSFEEHETQYKPLKALLEGTAEAKPPNVLIYATTNRKNLVRESFADRGVPGDDVHERDTLLEKTSLAARFGLRITFSAPDQERFVQIATAIARARGLALPDAELRARALAWDRRHGGRSGRSARQFADELAAEIAEDERRRVHL